MDLLSSYANVGTDIESVINDLPLLNIFVPDLPDFSAEKWNVATDAIPMVAISLDTDSRKIKILNDQAQVIEVSRMEPPTFPVIVLKNNERVSVRRNNEGKEKGNERSNKIILKNEIYSYALTNDNVENTAEGSRFDFFSSWDSKVRTAYTKSLNCGNCFHRDYIYYNISPTDGVYEGPFDPYYQEAITSIHFANYSALQAVASDWTEGNLELHFNIFFIGADPILDKVEKVYFASPSAFMTNGQLNAVPVNVNIKIVPWKMNVYGDRWKVAVYEYDPGTVSTSQYTSSTTKGTNFKADASGALFGVKVGVGFGASHTSTSTHSTTIQTTLSSNNLGEAVLNWFDPVIISKTPVGFGSYVSWSKELNTGSIRFSIEPVR